MFGLFWECFGKHLLGGSWTRRRCCCCCFSGASSNTTTGNTCLFFFVWLFVWLFVCYSAEDDEEDEEGDESVEAVEEAEHESTSESESHQSGSDSDDTGHPGGGDPMPNPDPVAAVIDALVAPVSPIAAALQRHGLQEINNELYMDGCKIGRLSFIHGVEMWIKASCDNVDHRLPEEPSSSTAKPKRYGHHCFCLLPATRDFVTRLDLVLQWLLSGQTVSRDAHIEAAVELARRQSPSLRRN